jgi:hypothetical protein
MSDCVLTSGCGIPQKMYRLKYKQFMLKYRALENEFSRDEVPKMR